MTELYIWNTVTGQQIRVLTENAGRINSVAFSQDGNLLAAGSRRSILLWDLRSGKQLRVLRGHTAMVNCLAFSPYSRLLASGSNDKTVRIWDMETGEQIQN